MCKIRAGIFYGTVTSVYRFVRVETLNPAVLCREIKETKS